MKEGSLGGNWGCLAPLVLLLLLPFVIYVAKEVKTWEGKKALPSSAGGIEEHYVHGIIGGDFTRLLKADLPEGDYAAYAKALGLSERFDPQVHEGIETILNLKVGGAPAWWNPPKVDSSSYFEHEDDYLRVLRYGEGCVYYLEVSW